MERRFIDLKTISGKGIKSFAFLKPSLYATVSLASGGGGGRLPDQKQKKQRTPADRTGGENPEWDHPIQIVLESQDQGLVLQFDIMAPSFLGDRLVGRVRVPVADLSPEGPAGAFRSASYLVKTSDGKPNGVLSFLYKMNGGEGRILAPPSAAGNSPPKMEYGPPPASTSGHYPPPPAPDPAIHYPPLDPATHYPPLDPATHYPPLDPAIHHPQPNPAIYYPQPDPAIHYPPLDPAIHYPPLDPAIYYPQPPADPAYIPRPYPANGYPAAPGGGYYPPVSPVHVACYPPQEPYDYRMEGHRRETYRCY